MDNSSIDYLINRINARHDSLMDFSRSGIVRLLERSLGPQNTQGCHKSTMVYRILVKEFGQAAVVAWREARRVKA
jgi:hypothetical protein